MTNQEFEALVAKLDAQAQRNPRAYKRRVFLLALLGYGYLGAAVTLLFALFLAALASAVFLKALAIKLIIPIGAFLWVVLRAMWVGFAPPEGRRVTRGETPALFEVIDRLRRKLQAPRFHRVLITEEFNAAVVQVPRLGMFGWYRNYLLLGLPLMKTLTLTQLEAVLAHEFGHLAGGHGRMSNWIYRLRMRWVQLVSILESQKSWGTVIFRSFFNWYAPYFSAYSFPLARANEYEADAASARLVSPQAAAEALTGVSVIGSYLEQRFWNGIHKQADETPRPAFAPYAKMGEGLHEDIEPAAARGWLQQAMALETTAADTHPSLADRLKAIGQTPSFAPPAADQTADKLLGSALDVITAEFDRRWQETISPSWEKRYQEVQEGRRRLAELDDLAVRQDLALDDAYERARLTESFGAGADAALVLFRTLHQRAPDHALYCFVLGQRLLWRDDESGFQLVERAMALDEDAIVPGCEALRDYCWRHDRKEEAHAWNDRLVKRQQLLAAARAERDRLHVRDKLERHGLSETALVDLRQQLQRVPGLKKVYLVRKRVQYFPDRPLFVLGFTTGHWWTWHNKRRAVEAQRRILDTVRFSNETLILNVEGNNRRFGRKLRFRRGSRIL